MRATREALGAASQALEILGGNGYMEDWPMARQLRDAQCHTIWEGTENICCLDVRRAMRREGAHEALFARVERALDGVAPGTRPRAGGRRGGRSRSTTRATRSTTSSGAANDLQLLHARASRSCSPTWPRARCCSTRRPGQLDRARRRPQGAWSPAGSRASGWRRLPVRGILDDDRTVLDHFEPIVRYGADRAGGRRMSAT